MAQCNTVTKRNCEWTNLAVVDAAHTSVVAWAQRLGAVGALEASNFVEYLQQETAKSPKVCQCVNV